MFTISAVLTPTAHPSASLTTAFCSTGHVCGLHKAKPKWQYKAEILSGQQGSVRPARIIAGDTGFSGQLQSGRGHPDRAGRQRGRQSSTMPDHNSSRADTASSSRAVTEHQHGRVLEVTCPTCRIVEVVRRASNFKDPAMSPTHVACGVDCLPIRTDVLSSDRNTSDHLVNEVVNVTCEVSKAAHSQYLSLAWLN